MTEKQKIKEALRQSAGGAEVITLSQISRFFGRKKPTTVDYRLTEGLLMNEARTVKVARERKYMTCSNSGKLWNVSLKEKVSAQYYICPVCWQKQHRALRKKKRKKGVENDHT